MLEVDICWEDKTIQLDPIISFTHKNKTGNGYCKCRFSIKHKHNVVKIKAIRFLNDDLEN